MKLKIELQDIVSWAREYGFIYQSSEIYDGLQAVYDYGYYGCLLKKNIKDLWWKHMVQYNNDIVGIDSSILMSPIIWKASGHVDHFDDLMIDNKDSKKRYRVDMMIEEYADKLISKGKKEKAQQVLNQMNQLINENNLDGLYNLIIDEKLVCPISGTSNWTNVRHFNLMFNISDDEVPLYLRPETAQGIYVNFLNIQRSTRKKIPFGIAQIGKAFRNEIIARQFTFRMREFEQMEMQFFIKPNEDNEWFEKWKDTRFQWYNNLGIDKEHLRIKPHDKLAHYAKAAVDIEYLFPFGFKEVEGIHARGDYDLSCHEKYSGKKLEYFDGETNQNFIPHVIETSAGCDRLTLMVLSECLIKEKNEDKERLYLNVNKNLAPIKLAILPLLKKDELITISKKIYDDLKFDYHISYDENHSIGKRYVRNDLIGTLYCVTIDYDTINDNCVTVRDRNTMNQERININQLKQYCRDNL